MEAFSVFFYGISLTDLGTNIAIHDKLKQHLSYFFDSNCYLRETHFSETKTSKAVQFAAAIKYIS